MGKADVIIGLIGPALLLWLIAIFWRRKLYREFPFFFSYILAVVFITIVRLSVNAISGYELFFKAYWATEAVYAMLATLALHEVFRRVFIEFDEYWWFWFLFPGACIPIAFLSIRSAVAHPPAQAPHIVVVILALGSTIRYIQGGLFILFFLLVRIFAVSWANYPFGIVTGFAVSAAGSGLAYLVRSEFGTKYSSFFKYAPPVAYFLAVLIWLAFFLRPRPARSYEWAGNVTPAEVMEELRSYLRILRGKGKG